MHLQETLPPKLSLLNSSLPQENNREHTSTLAAKQLKPYPHLQVILKPGKAHHPHSLPNPAPITDFALSCYGLTP
ncbi:MAG: hypothetical protein ACSHX6_14955 [Akkermansiaceae bacterium]